MAHGGQQQPPPYRGVVEMESKFYDKILMDTNETRVFRKTVIEMIRPSRLFANLRGHSLAGEK
jgi:hypothetical protein